MVAARYAAFLCRHHSISAVLLFRQQTANFGQVVGRSTAWHIVHHCSKREVSVTSCHLAAASSWAQLRQASRAAFCTRPPHLEEVSVGRHGQQQKGGACAATKQHCCKCWGYEIMAGELELLRSLQSHRCSSCTVTHRCRLMFHCTGRFRLLDKEDKGVHKKVDLHVQ